LQIDQNYTIRNLLTLCLVQIAFSGIRKADGTNNNKKKKKTKETKKKKVKKEQEAKLQNETKQTNIKVKRARKLTENGERATFCNYNFAKQVTLIFPLLLTFSLSK